jgi:outer membrane protein assembly factor BamB
MMDWFPRCPGRLALACACLGLLPLAQAEDWPQFRGAARDNVSKETGLLRKWPAGGPKVLWTIPVGQGYAGAAVVGGRVYHNDYDEAKGVWGVFCRNLTTGKEIWRYTEPRKIRPNHAITRTVPAVDARFVFALDPKCNLYALDARAGRKVWQKDLVAVYKTRIPPWYNGQNPLIEADRIVHSNPAVRLIAGRAHMGDPRHLPANRQRDRLGGNRQSES